MKNDQSNGGRWRTQEGDLQAVAGLEEIATQERRSERRGTGAILTDQSGCPPSAKRKNEPDI